MMYFQPTLFLFFFLSTYTFSFFILTHFFQFQMLFYESFFLQFPIRLKSIEESCNLES